MKLTFMVALLILAIIGVAAYAYSPPPFESARSLYAPAVGYWADSTTGAYRFLEFPNWHSGPAMLQPVAPNATGQYGTEISVMTQQGSGESTHFMDMGRCAVFQAVARSGTYQWRNRTPALLQIRI